MQPLSNPAIATQNSRFRQIRYLFCRSDARAPAKFRAKRGKNARAHAEADYTGAWLGLFDQIVRYGHTVTNADHRVWWKGAM